MTKTQAKQLVVCVENDGYAVSLEKRKIYVALRDAAAEKHHMLRIVGESGEDYLEGILPFDRAVASCQKGGAGGIARTAC
jgi:TPP-dependent pyruvate/acetoin dehydrogenase alpha subunit